MRVTGACDCFCYGLATAQAIASVAILFGSSMTFLSLAKIGLISVVRSGPLSPAKSNSRPLRPGLD